jgi:hypothetical protein
MALGQADLLARLLVCHIPSFQYSNIPWAECSITNQIGPEVATHLSAAPEYGSWKAQR